jgi:hypothetical protein
MKKMKYLTKYVYIARAKAFWYCIGLPLLWAYNIYMIIKIYNVIKGGN